MDLGATYVITFVGNFKSTIESIHPLLKPVDESHVSNRVMPNGTIPLGYQTVFAVDLRDVLSFAHTRRERQLQFATGLVVEGAPEARIDKALGGENRTRLHQYCTDRQSTSGRLPPVEMSIAGLLRVVYPPPSPLGTPARLLPRETLSCGHCHQTFTVELQDHSARGSDRGPAAGAHRYCPNCVGAATTNRGRPSDGFLAPPHTSVKTNRLAIGNR